VTEIGEAHRAITARFDSIDAQLRTLTEMVAQVLERLPGESDT
jgi:hypothetical protein